MFAPYLHVLTDLFSTENIKQQNAKGGEVSEEGINILSEQMQQLHLPSIIGSDRNDGAIQSTLMNAKRAGVDMFLQLESCSLKANSWFKEEQNSLPSCSSSKTKHSKRILIATNPPFGLRISSSSKQKRGKNRVDIHPLLPLYQSFGIMIKELMNGHKSDIIDVGILAHEIDLARKTGVPDLKKEFTTCHGGISITALGNVE